MRTHESKRKDYAPIKSDSRSRWLALVGVALVARLCDTEAAIVRARQNYFTIEKRWF